MIRFLSHNEIEKKRWNETIKTSLHSTLFAHYEYLTLVSSEWGALIKGDYEAVMPLPVRIKFSIKYIFTPFQFPRLGIFSKTQLTDADVLAFVQAIPRCYKQIDLKLNQYNPSQLIESESISLISHQLRLDKDYATLFQQFSTNTKRNIKSAEKHHLMLVDTISIEEIIHLFQENRGKSKNISIKKGDYELFRNMAHYAYNEGNLELWGVKDADNNLLAGACFLNDYDTRWFWFSGRNNAMAHKKAMFFLMNKYIQKNANQPFILDFDGSMNQNIARFYKGFGGTAYLYPMLCFSRRFYLTPLIKLYKMVQGKK